MTDPMTSDQGKVTDAVKSKQSKFVDASKKSWRRAR